MRVSKSVISIGNFAFRNCNILTSIIVDDDNPNYKSLNGNLYDKNGTTLIQYAIGKTDAVFTVPNSVIKIGVGAFSCCYSLRNVIIPNSVTNIGSSAFFGCSSLQITIPNSVTNIGSSAFKGCDQVISVEGFFNDEQQNNKTNQNKALPPTMSNIKIGDIIEFGKWEQSKSGEFKPIKWQVLNIENDQALIISKHALSCMPFNKEDISVTWENCSLRSWLNNEFYNEAFSYICKNKIVKTIITTDKNPSYDTPQGENTNDNVFLLSIKEANKYFMNNEARECKATEYCYDHGAFKSQNGYCSWWLRTSGKENDCAALVYFGRVDNDGGKVHSRLITVRPAMWIKIE